MPFSFQIDEGLDLLRVEAGGLLTPALLHECVAEHVAHSNFRPTMDVLFELGTDISIEIEGREEQPVVLAKDNVLEDVRALIAEARAGCAYRMACVGGSARHPAFFIAGMGLVSAQAETTAFEKLPAALEWLDERTAAKKIAEPRAVA